MKAYNYEMVKNARNLFFAKGIVNREVLRNDISISWARSQMFNVDKKEYLKSDVQYLKEIPLISEKEFTDIFSDNLICILGINKSGNPIINFFSQIDDLNFLDINFSANSIGTNGIGLALTNKRSSWTNPFENYSEILDDYTIIGIPQQKECELHIIGYIYKKSKIVSEADMPEFEKHSSEIVSKIPEKDDKNECLSYEVENFSNYFVGSSKFYIDFFDRFNLLKGLKSNVFIEGKKGTGKEILARLLHSESGKFDKDFFPIYCDKIPEEVFINNYLNLFMSENEKNKLGRIGTVYFESIDSLSYKSQEQLTKLLESKPVNTANVKASDLKGVRCIFSSEKSLENLRNGKEILEKLLGRVNVMSIKIPEISEVKSDMRELIDFRIQKFSERYYLPKIRFSDELLLKLSENKWKGNYRELDKMIEGIIRNGRHETLIDVEYYYECCKEVYDEAKLFKTIESVEKEHIVRTLEGMNFNLLESAKVLGISRSTLYRKIEKYEIKL